MYRAVITNAGDYEFKIRTANSEFTIDARGKGVNPLEALLSAIGSCMGVYVRKYAEGSHLDLSNFQIEVEAELTKDPPLSFKSIDVYLELKGAGLDEPRKAALLEFVKKCPVHNTLKGNPLIKVGFK